MRLPLASVPQAAFIAADVLAARHAPWSACLRRRTQHRVRDACRLVAAVGVCVPPHVSRDRRRLDRRLSALPAPAYDPDLPKKRLKVPRGSPSESRLLVPEVHWCKWRPPAPGPRCVCATVASSEGTVTVRPPYGILPGLDGHAELPGHLGPGLRSSCTARRVLPATPSSRGPFVSPGSDRGRSDLPLEKGVGGSAGARQ